MCSMTFPIINPSGLFGKQPPDIDASTGRHVMTIKTYGRPRAGRSFYGPELDLQVSVYAWAAGDRLRHHMNKRTRYKTPSRTRTTSARQRAGSRKGNGRQTFASDLQN
jgi:hypothetical protein